MNRRTRILALMGATLLVCIALPMLGAVLRGAPANRYLEFPPRTQYIEHAPFSWPVFWGLLAAEVVLWYVPLGRILLRTRVRIQTPVALRRRFPWWGWGGLVLGAVSWVLAWTRFGWFAPLQRHTFTPLWVAYILVVNAWTYRRSGHCMLKDRPEFFAALFPVSAGFWWLFEYLNRFVQNWHYINIGDVGAWEYFWMATLPFSTVLPAVLGTYEWLGTFFGETPLTWPPAEPVPRSRPGPSLVLLVAVAGLFMVGAYPDYFFPLVWIAPFLVLAVLLAWAGEDSLLFHASTPQSARRLALLAAAALVCGFFWEMWNARSFAKWVYAVPYVNRFRLFEMPCLGYAGYLPFGWECGLVGAALLRLLHGNGREADTP